MDTTRKRPIWQEEALINQEDFIKSIVEHALQNILDAEFAHHIGADQYERTEERTGYRNGSYQRQLQTRVGSLTLHVCRDRTGTFKTALFEKYQRSEKALLGALLEAYFMGVSTRRIKSIVEELCGQSISKSQVSRLMQSLDSEIDAWRNRPLVGEYPYLLFDARYEKIRDGGKVVSKACVIILGITKKGVREILGTWIINSESAFEWDDCIKHLKQRGLKGVMYVVSDENAGLRKALQKHFQSVIQQRCQVHFMRNMIFKLPKKLQKEAISLLQEVFGAQTYERAFHCLEHLLDLLKEHKKETVALWLEETVEDCLQVLHLPLELRKKLKSTNMLERLNQEIKRRTRTIRIFPNDASCLRLVTSLCQEISEHWGTRRYLPLVD